MQYQADICYRAAILLPFLSMGLIVFFGKGSFSSILNYITYVSSNFTLTLQVVQKNILRWCSWWCRTGNMETCLPLLVPEGNNWANTM